MNASRAVNLGLEGRAPVSKAHEKKAKVRRSPDRSPVGGRSRAPSSPKKHASQGQSGIIGGEIAHAKPQDGDSSRITVSSVLSADKDPEDNFLGDSELESQMDDFKLKEDSNKDSSVEIDADEIVDEQAKPIKMKLERSELAPGGHGRYH